MQLGEAYNGLGDFKKKIYFSQEINIKRKKNNEKGMVLLALY
jgi:hypothetical protein